MIRLSKRKLAFRFAPEFLAGVALLILLLYLLSTWGDEHMNMNNRLSGTSICYLDGKVSAIEEDAIVLSVSLDSNNDSESVVVIQGPQVSLPEVHVGEHVVVYYFPEDRDRNRIIAYAISEYREEPSPQDFITPVN